jgi:DNA-binding MarR family transcriptional regulator
MPRATAAAPAALASNDMASSATASGVTAAAALAPEPTDLFVALGAVVKRLRHNPLPGGDAAHNAFHGANPAPRHIAALLHIAAHGPIGMTELAERLHVSLATMSQVVTELGDWGLVERSTDTDDRRRTLVTVAAEHRPLTRAMLDQRLRPMQRTLRRLEPAEAAALLHGLLILAEELDHTKTGKTDKSKELAR